MSYDGFVTHCVVDELKKTVLKGKVDKIYQHDADEIVLSVRTFTGNYRILMSANASNPRVHLTEEKHENPSEPPMFCMLLRKKLSGAVISNIEQNGFDRVIKFDFDARNELGDICALSLTVEIMGRHSNIILTDENRKILDSIKHVDFTVSAVRQILPGLYYDEPPTQDKKNPSELTMTELMNDIDTISDDYLLDKFLLDEITGMSPLLARELVYRNFGSVKAVKGDVDTAQFTVDISEFIESIKNGIYSPSVVIDKTERKPIAFSCVLLSQYEDGADVEKCESISNAIELYYLERSRREHIKRKSAAILKLVSNNIERCEKKIAMHKDIIERSQSREKYKTFGDLITANIYRIHQGDKEISVENYYSENADRVTIPLSEELSPSQNAQRYYRKHKKEKRSEEYSIEQLKLAEEEKYYLESVFSIIEKIETTAELDEIRDELVDEGYILRKRTEKKRSIKHKSEPLKFVSDDGFEILVGRNNRQNDELTLKKAYATDIWLHTKNIPGSHTIIRTKGTGEASDNAIVQAASLTAYYSKAKNSSKVPVDYTQVKNVKKPNGAKPGMVIYDCYNTVYVEPSDLINNSH